MKKNFAWLVVAILAIGGVFFFFLYRMGTNDAKALADFPIAYSNYDQAISNYSNAVLVSKAEDALTQDGLERIADQALAALNAGASVRISSLTKNDGDLMSVSLEISDLAGKELDTLKAYRRMVADKSIEINDLSKELADLMNQRQAAYTHYLELAGQKN